MSKASTIASAISSRVASITVANGYATDIGLRVFRGRASLNVQDLPCVVMVEAEDSVEEMKGTQARVVQRYVLEGHDQCDPAQPNDKAHLIMTDLKKAIFGGDITFGGVVKPSGLTYVGRSIGTREDGTDICAASITIDVQFVEDLANP